MDVGGMSCRSCEVKIERALSALPGVESVSADATKGTVRVRHRAGTPPERGEIEAGLRKLGYEPGGSAQAEGDGKKPSFWTVVGLFALVLVLGKILGSLGLLNVHASVGEATGFAAIFVLGLVAASSSCMAVSGGLLLSSAAKFRERYGSGTIGQRMKPVFLFVGGRIASYTALGGAIGAIGKALQPSPAVSGTIAVAAALYMMVMGLEMLGIAPGWLRRMMPRMPKALSKRLLTAEGKDHPLVPLALGAATFFLPCGFTQSLQLYALTTGSFYAGASALFAFALGTAPALLALGLATGSLKGTAGKFFFRFSGALVVTLGLWNVSNGLALAGHPIALPEVAPAAADAAPMSVQQASGEQTVAIQVGWSGYSPSHFTLKAGVPAVLEMSGPGTQGCGGTLVIPRLGINEFLTPGKTTRIAFTPTEPGSYNFACSMGMLRGSFDVID